MSIQITHFPDINDMVTVLQPGAQGSVAMVFNHGEQRELLEALARVQGFTLVDRKELQSLTEEVYEDENDYDSAVEAWTAWQDRAEALAAAVSSALRFENDEEV